MMRNLRKINLLSLLILSVLVLAGDALAKPSAKELWSDVSSNGVERPNIELKLPSFAPIIEELGKSVVNISISGTASLSKEELKRFAPFLGELPKEREFQSLGSGFVIHKDGYIVTNNHVVEKADKISVKFKNDSEEYPAEVIGRDPKTDIALIKVEVKKELTPVVVGNSEKLRTGDWVIAIGNPFRLGHTATVGVVSAKGRKVAGGGPYDDFIQTDASINPGNSGGPLFNAEGEVVGVNTAISSPGRTAGRGFNIGIGFATPINLVRDIVSQIHDKGRVTRGWLGVLIQKVDADMADILGLEKTVGALVADVMPESPAEKGGVKRRDVIVSFDGRAVQENDDLPLMVAQTPVNKEVDVVVIRKGSEKTLRIKINELKEDAAGAGEEEDNSGTVGATVQKITPEIASSMGLESNNGVIISAVEPGSVAEKAGLTRGDVVLEVGDVPINSAKEFAKLTKKLEVGKPILLLIKRSGNTLFITLKKE